MSENRFAILIKTVKEISAEFAQNENYVSEKMITDLWEIFGNEDLEEVDHEFEQFIRQWEAIDNKVLGGLKNAFLEYLKIKELSKKVEEGKPVKHGAYITTEEASVEYNLPYKSLTRWLRKGRDKGKLKPKEDFTPYRYYRRDLEVLLIDLGKIKGITDKTKEIEKSYFKLEEKTRKFMKRLNKED